MEVPGKGAVMIARDLFRRGKISGAELSEIIEGDKLFGEVSPIINWCNLFGRIAGGKRNAM